MRYLLSERPMQERGHLASGYDTAGTVHVVDWRVASSSDPSGSQLVDIVLEDGVVIVDEQVSAAVVDIADGPYQERGHLLSGDLAIRAEAIIGWRVTSLSDPRRGQPVNVTLEDRIVIVDEQILRSQRFEVAK